MQTAWTYVEYRAVASSRVDFKTHQYSTSYPVRNGSKRFRIYFSRSFSIHWPKMTIPHRFQTEKSGRKQKTVLNIVWAVLIHDPTCDKSVFNAFLGDFFPSKTWFFESSENFGHFWPLLVTFFEQTTKCRKGFLTQRSPFEIGILSLIKAVF